eukprot:Hpha_TRINITY_DN16467_c2_g1::TRINITY_DN16467_c2_g1_i1::g.160826::m.160826
MAVPAVPPGMVFWSETVRPDCLLSVSAREHAIVITHAALPDPKHAAELLVGPKANIVACALTRASPQRRLDMVIRKGAAMHMNSKGGAVTLCGWTVRPAEAKPAAVASPAASPAAPPVPSSPKRGKKPPSPAASPAPAPARAAAKNAPPVEQPARRKPELGPVTSAWNPTKGKKPDPQLVWWQRSQDLDLVDDGSSEDAEVEARPVVIQGKDYYLNANTYRVYQGEADAAVPVGFYHPDKRQVLPHPPDLARPSASAGARAHRTKLHQAGAVKRKAAAAADSDSDEEIGSSESEEGDAPADSRVGLGPDNVVPLSLIPDPAEKLRRFRKKQRVSKLRESGEISRARQ